jgi:hypothetical protein
MGVTEMAGVITVNRGNCDSVIFKKFSFLQTSGLFLALLLLSFTYSRAGVEEIRSVKDSSILNTRITLNIKDKSLNDVIVLLSDVHSIGFLYIEEQIPQDVRIAELKGAYLLKDLLNLMLKNTNLTYFLIDEQIGLTTKEFSESIEIDSVTKQAKIYPASGSSEDLRNYRKVKVRGVKSATGNNYPVRYYYLRKNFSFNIRHNSAPYVEQYVNDTITDTINGKIVKRKVRIKIPVQADDETNSLILKITPGYASWRIRVNDRTMVDNIGMNDYAESHSSFSASVELQSRVSDKLFLRMGIGYLLLNKQGTHTITRINEFYTPFRSFTESKTYSNNFSYLHFPASLAFKTGRRKIYLMLKGELAANVFLGSDMKYYPVYQFEYFSDINPLIKTSESYHSKSGDPIVRQEAEFLPVVFSIGTSAELYWRFAKGNSIFVAPEFKSFLRSVYNRNAPVRERPSALGFTLGYKLSF